MYYDATTGKVACIDGSGWSGRRATQESFRNVDLPAHGAQAVLVPGAVEALLRASEMYGRLPREELLAPSIKLAEEGFVLSETHAEQLHSAFGHKEESLQKFASAKAFWFRDGKPLRMGDIVVQKELARTFRLIAHGGRDAFYRGPIARRIVEFLGENGGILDESDFAEYEADVCEPLFVNYRGYSITDGGLSGFRHVLLASLKILEEFDLTAMGHNSSEYIHYVTEAMKLAFADRDAVVGDRRFPAAMEQILTDEFIRERRGLIRKGRAMGVVPPGEYLVKKASSPEASLVGPVYAANRGSVGVGQGGNANPYGHADGDTTYVTVIDKDGNMASIVSTLGGGFGSKMYVDGLGGGFFLNDWLGLFRTDPSHPNVLAPRKVPRTGWNAMLVLKDGKPFMSFGTPGGDTIPQFSLQFFLNFVDFGMNVQQALEQPAFVTTAFQSQRHPNALGRDLVVSKRIPEQVRDQLAKWGHHVVPENDRLGVGSVKSIWIDRERGVLQGGVAPATDSYVIGR